VDLGDLRRDEVDEHFKLLELLAFEIAAIKVCLVRDLLFTGCNQLGAELEETSGEVSVASFPSLVALYA
jgi:hypothetical protein